MWEAAHPCVLPCYPEHSMVHTYSMMSLWESRTQFPHSAASTISITVLSHTRCLSQPQGDYFDIISCNRMLRKTILPLVTCPKGKIYDEWHVTDVSYVASFYQLSHLLYCASHIYWWYPASLQLICFCSIIHCCEVCVCKIDYNSFIGIIKMHFIRCTLTQQFDMSSWILKSSFKIWNYRR